MTIRYTCVKCASVLKIKDDRAGKDGHCPKCKAKFVVPAPDSDDSAEAIVVEEPVAALATEPAPAGAPAGGTQATVAAESAGGDSADADFDPVAFLMTDGAPAKPAPSRAAATAAEEPDLRVARSAGPAAYTASEEPDERVGGPRRPPPRDADEDSATDLRRKPKKPAVPSAAQTADAMLRVNASTNAKDLLTRTMEESRVRAAQMPEDRRAPGIDYAGAARELLTRFAPAVGGTVLLIVLTYWFSTYMAGGGADLPPLGQVSGTVTKAGQPLSGAYVTFSPVDIKGGAGSSYTDEQGFYELKYTEGVEGTPVGKNLVEVSFIGPDGREVVKAKTKYGLGASVMETVKEGSQTIDIPIP